jgi:threonine/homoserine/homoserine lactone efflux protein
VSAAAFLAFVGVSLLVIVTPGPDTALTIGNTLGGGRKGGLFTALGVATGQATWTLATSAGLATLLVASEPAFVALKAVGGAYLVYLGAQALLRARRGHASAAAERRLSSAAAYRRGLVSNLGNPKMAVFFASLLPQFAPKPLSFVSLAGLGLVFCTMTLGWLSAYAVVVARLGDVLRRGRARRILDALTGSVLVAVGVRLATERR